MWLHGTNWEMYNHLLQQVVMKKALAHDGLSRGLHESARAIERGQAQLAILADDCNQPDYKKLIEALCAEQSVNLISVPEQQTLGQWAGLCKIDSEGEARKVRCAAVAQTWPACCAWLRWAACCSACTWVRASHRLSSSRQACNHQFALAFSCVSGRQVLLRRDHRLRRGDRGPGHPAGVPEEPLSAELAPRWHRRLGMYCAVCAVLPRRWASRAGTL